MFTSTPLFMSGKNDRLGNYAMTKMILAATAALFVGGFAGAAFAAPVQDTPAQAVSVAGVNFNDRTDVQKVYTRINRAARVACDSNSANPVIAQADQICAKRAVAEAVATLNRPVLTAMYENRGATGQTAFAGNDQ